MRILIFLFLISSACQNQLHKIDTIGADADPSENSSDTLTIMALNIGQGDATLIQTPSGHVFLIDTGPPESGRQVITPLLSQLNLVPDAIFVSHYDADHIGGMAEIIAGSDLLPIIYDRGESPTDADSVFENYLEAVTPYREEFHAGDQINLADGVKISCLILDGQLSDGTIFDLDPEDENGRSMGLLIEYGDFRYWTSGDLTGGGLNGSDMESAVAPLIGDVDILHVDHHGSLTSSSKEFLDALNPEAAIISAGTDNSYGHPAPEIISRLLDRDIEIYLTSPSSTLDPEIVHQAETMVMVTVKNGGEDYTVELY